MSTVLILEKEDILKKLYREELEEEGYRILLVEDEKGALKMLEENVPDLIITNYQIPSTESYISMLHMANKIKGIPVIIYTAFPREMIDADSYKMTDYLVKSSNLNELKNKIREMVIS